MVSKAELRKLMKLLSVQEKKIVTQLLKLDNVTQKYLRQKTGVPKATMFRALKKLEIKGIVKQVGFGAGKRVTLTKWAKGWRRRQSSKRAPLR
jgi:uncharacterized membrane protein